MASPFRHLIYPMPEEGGLGAHLTLNLQNEAQFGPDVEWCASPLLCPLNEPFWPDLGLLELHCRAHILWRSMPACGRVDDIDYTVNPKRAERFYEKARHYWPGLPDGALKPAYSGKDPSH